MPTIFDLFGYPIGDRSEVAEKVRKSRLCPFMDGICDGGGNRYQTEIPLTATEPLTKYFDVGVRSVVPGVCSILSGKDIWVVCPRRLFAARHSEPGFPIANHALHEHERALLIGAGLPRGVDLGVWPEVSMNQTIGDADINYHFDYIVAPLVNASLASILEGTGLQGDQLALELGNLTKSARKSGYLPQGLRDVKDVPTLLPDLTSPVILEVMTASTSGSDTEKATDIRSAFRGAVLGEGHTSPGINKRQVWGRMVTQLFAKSALAREWGGTTVWIIQDELLRNIELTTRLRTNDIIDHPEHNISLVVMHYELDLDGNRTMSFKARIDGDSGVDFGGNDSFTDILLPKIAPPKLELFRAVLRRKIGGILNL